MKRGQPYLDRAVQWIAHNDEPTITDRDEIEEFLSVALVADTFNVHRSYVAKRVALIRAPRS